MLKYLDPIADRAAETVRLSKVTRRGFLGATGAFALAAHAVPAHAFETYPTGGADMPHGVVDDPLVFVAIDTDGTVTLVAHRSEMGTGSRTSIPMVMADEMEADWARVTIVQAPGDEPKYGNQDTDGSRSLRHHIQAAARSAARSGPCSRAPRPPNGAWTPGRSPSRCTRSGARRDRPRALATSPRRRWRSPCPP